MPARKGAGTQDRNTRDAAAGDAIEVEALELEAQFLDGALRRALGRLDVVEALGAVKIDKDRSPCTRNALLGNRTRKQVLDFGIERSARVTRALRSMPKSRTRFESGYRAKRYECRDYDLYRSSRRQAPRRRQVGRARDEARRRETGPQAQEPPPRSRRRRRRLGCCGLGFRAPFLAGMLADRLRGRRRTWMHGAEA